MTAKEKAQQASDQQLARACLMYATATVQTADGTTAERPVRMWYAPPRWFGQASPDQRQEWIRGYFARQLNLQAGEVVTAAVCKVGA